jgi:uncharacterized membrane protein YkvA (DUF1232 family)
MRQPSLHETEVFEGLCGDVSRQALASLRAAVKQHLRDVDQAARQNELLATDLAEELARKLDGLLAELESLPEEARPLVVGAARYFVSDQDALPDYGGPLGLDDDVAVFNAVARRIGRADLEIAG